MTRAWTTVAMVLCGLVGSAEATHFRYDHITWTKVNANTVKFTVTTAWRADFDNPIQINFEFGDGAQQFLDITTNNLPVTAPNFPQGPITIVNRAEDYFIAVNTV